MAKNSSSLIVQVTGKINQIWSNPDMKKVLKNGFEKARGVSEGVIKTASVQLVKVIKIADRQIKKFSGK